MTEQIAVPDPDPEQLRQTVERLLDETVDRDDQFAVEVEDLTVEVPVRFDETSPTATWGFDGRMTVTVDGVRKPLREWLEFLEE